MQLHDARTQLCARVSPARSAATATTRAEASQGGLTADGMWAISRGSIAGFRCQASVLGHVTPIVGHSTALMGSIEVAGGGVSAGSFRIDLASLRIFGKPNAALNRMIDTARYPLATFVLEQPISLDASPSMNVTYHAPATGSRSLHGVTRPATFTFSARYPGSVLEGAGSIPVRFSDRNLKAPIGVQRDGAIDVTLRMRRSVTELPALRGQDARIPQTLTWAALD